MSRQDHTFQGADGEFHFVDWGGSGPLAHFSHATGLCAGTYSPLADKLTAQLRVFGMDDRGHGRSRAPTDPRKLKNWDIFVDDLECFVESLDAPVIALGHSRGATVSLLLAIKRPDLIRALVLIDPTILPISWMGWWYLAKLTGLARFVPIIATAARRKYVWPDRTGILEAYRNKAAFRTWRDGFLEAYIQEGTEETGQGTIRLCCHPFWESRCFAACPHGDTFRGCRSRPWFCTVRDLTPSWLQQQRDSKPKLRELHCGVLKMPVISFRWNVRMKPQRSFWVFSKMKKNRHA